MRRFWFTAAQKKKKEVLLGFDPSTVWLHSVPEATEKLFI